MTMDFNKQDDYSFQSDQNNKKTNSLWQTMRESIDKQHIHMFFLAARCSGVY
jgi:hypothetical protein